MKSPCTSPAFLLQRDSPVKAGARVQGYQPGMSADLNNLHTFFFQVNLI